MNAEEWQRTPAHALDLTTTHAHVAGGASTSGNTGAATPTSAPIDTLITDDETTQEQRDPFISAGIEVVIA